MLHSQIQDISAVTQRKLSSFFAELSRASSRALVLDYDGTLARFCTDPERAISYPGIQALLGRIQDTANTRMVVVTGRRAMDAAQLLGIKRIEVWGCHGLERLHADGTYEMPKVDPRVIRAIETADQLLATEGLSSLLEHKPAATAIHWRGLETEAANTVMRKVQAVWSRLPNKAGLSLLRFDGGMEIRAAARNKGDAVRTIVSEMGESASIAYLGDDKTDEDAFAALQGYGLSVLVKSSYRPTVADVWIRPSEGVIGFLTDWANACESAR